jgi:hypothetical protein
MVPLLPDAMPGFLLELKYIKSHLHIEELTPYIGILHIELFTYK